MVVDYRVGLTERADYSWLTPQGLPILGTLSKSL